MKKAPWVGILLLLLASGCGGTDSDGAGNGSALPQPATGTGIIMGKLTLGTILSKAHLGITVVSVSVKGVTVKLEEDESLSDVTDADGNFLINNVPEGTWTIFADLTDSDGKRFAVRTPNIVVIAGNVVDLETLTLNETGAIQGNVRLEGESDHIGIDVFIPGTSFLAKTDSQGNFTILYIPEGTYDIRAEKLGFNPYAFVNISVTSGQVTALPSITLTRLRTSFNITGSMRLSWTTDHGNVPVKLALIPSGSDYETVTASDGSYMFSDVLPGAYFLRAGDRTNSCTSRFPGTSDGEISTFVSDNPIASVTNADVALETITLHPGACATIVGEDASGSYTLPHRGFNFDTRTFTDSPEDADLFLDVEYAEPFLGLSDCLSWTFSVNGNDLLLIETDPQPDIFTAFQNLREVPSSNFTSFFSIDWESRDALFIVRTLSGNYVKIINPSIGYRNADGFTGCFVSLKWQLQPDGASTFDY